MKSKKIKDLPALLVRLRNGDSKAFTKFMNAYQDAVYSTAYKLLSNKTFAADVVQEVFAKIWKDHEKFVVENMDGYLYIACRHCVINLARTLQRDQARIEKMDQPDYQVENTDYGVRESFLWRMLDQLPKQQRIVFQLSAQQGMPNEGIALKLGISVTTVKNHLDRARKRLAGIFNNHYA